VLVGVGVVDGVDELVGVGVVLGGDVLVGVGVVEEGDVLVGAGVVLGGEALVGVGVVDGGLVLVGVGVEVGGADEVGAGVVDCPPTPKNAMSVWLKRLLLVTKPQACCQPDQAMCLLQCSGIQSTSTQAYASAKQSLERTSSCM
jgi:hypothetical protein